MSKFNKFEDLKNVKIPAEGETPANENPVPVPEQKPGLVDRAYESYKLNWEKTLEKKAAKEAAKAEKKAAKEAKKSEKKADRKHLGAKIAAGVVLGGAVLGAAAKLAMGAHTANVEIPCEGADQDVGEDACTESCTDVPSEN